VIAMLKTIDNVFSHKWFGIVLVAVAFLSTSAQVGAERFRYGKFFAVLVGETKVVYAVRHRDCESMPSFDRLRERLPETALGTFSDGGEMTAKSRSCDAEVPTRGIAFTAMSKGEETMTFFGDEVTITVE